MKLNNKVVQVLEICYIPPKKVTTIKGKKPLKVDAHAFLTLATAGLGSAITQMNNCLYASEIVPKQPDYIGNEVPKTIIGDRAVEVWIEGQVKEKLSGIDVGGYTVLLCVQRLAYWVCAIVCAVHIMKHCNDGNLREIVNTIVYFAVTCGCIFCVQFLLNWIWRIFV